MGPGPIPLTEIEAYLRMFGIVSHDEVSDWVYLLREMDREYLNVMSEKEANK